MHSGYSRLKSEWPLHHRMARSTLHIKASLTDVLALDRVLSHLGYSSSSAILKPVRFSSDSLVIRCVGTRPHFCKLVYLLRILDLLGADYVLFWPSQPL